LSSLRAQPVAWALCDIQATELGETAALCAGSGRTITTHVIDTADREAVFQLATDVVESHGKVNLVINNAGVTSVYPVSQLSAKDFDWVIGINLNGMVYGTLAFLPALKERPRGELARVVNISSMFASVCLPGNAPYCASKAGIKAFTQVLQAELLAEGSNVRATYVMPAGIRTNIVNHARRPDFIVARGALADTLQWLPKVPAGTMVDSSNVAMMFDRMVSRTPDEAAATIIGGIENGRDRILIGVEAYLGDCIARAWPGVITSAIWLSSFFQPAPSSKL